MSKKTKKLESYLTELENNSGIIISALVNRKGQLMASGSQLKDLDNNALSAMSAALTSVGARVGSTLACGELASIQISGTNRLVLVNALDSSVLISVGPAESKVGLLDFEISKTIDKINEAL